MELEKGCLLIELDTYAVHNEQCQHAVLCFLTCLLFSFKCALVLNMYFFFLDAVLLEGASQ